jgi:hypothetical protein
VSAWHWQKRTSRKRSKMVETVRLSTHGRELLRGWWRPIGLMLSFMIFTASVWNILDTPSYVVQCTCTVAAAYYRRFVSFIISYLKVKCMQRGRIISCVSDPSLLSKFAAFLSLITQQLLPPTLGHR